MANSGIVDWLRDRELSVLNRLEDGPQPTDHEPLKALVTTTLTRALVKELGKLPPMSRSRNFALGTIFRRETVGTPWKPVKWVLRGLTRRGVSSMTSGSGLFPNG